MNNGVLLVLCNSHQIKTKSASIMSGNVEIFGKNVLNIMLEELTLVNVDKLIIYSRTLLNLTDFNNIEIVKDKRDYFKEDSTGIDLRQYSRDYSDILLIDAEYPCITKRVIDSLIEKHRSSHSEITYLYSYVNGFKIIPNIIILKSYMFRNVYMSPQAINFRFRLHQIINDLNTIKAKKEGFELDNPLVICKINYLKKFEKEIIFQITNAN